MDRLQIERIGGFAGFGGPHLKSRGELALSDLSVADRQAVEDLFSDPQKAEAVPVAPGAADFYTYNITLQTAAGTRELKDVPGHVVPAALRDSVKDALQ